MLFQFIDISLSNETGREREREMERIYDRKYLVRNLRNFFLHNTYVICHGKLTIVDKQLHAAMIENLVRNNRGKSTIVR